MKKMVSALISFAIVAAVQPLVAPNCGVHAASVEFIPPDFDYREISEDTTQYLDEFMELSLEELSAVKLYDGQGKRLERYCCGSFNVIFSEEEVSQMLKDLAQQQGNDTDYSDNKKVFCEYLLDRMHLKGIYEAWPADDSVDYLTAIDLNTLRGIEDNIPFSEVDVAVGSQAVKVSMWLSSYYPVEYQGETIWMDRREFYMRMLYTATKYGELYLYPEELALDDTTQTTTTETTTTTTTTTTVTTTTTANGVATGDAPVMYLLLAGVGAAAAASLTQKRKKHSV